MQTGGALLELVARGKKDAVLAASGSAGAPPLCLYTQAAPGAVQKPTPSVSEFRATPPRNTARWGGYVDFEVEGGVGDVLREATLLIDLPSWLPPEFAAAARATTGARPRVLHAPSNAVLGYAPNVALRLVRHVQLFVDANVVQEWWGGWGEATQAEGGGEGDAAPQAAAVGWHDGSAAALCRACGGGNTLRLRLPALLGGSVLACALSQRQTLRLRVHLARLGDCLAAVDAESGLPRPLPLPPDGWTATLLTPRYDTPFTDDVAVSTVATARRETLPPPGLALRFRHEFVRPDARELLRAGAWRTPFLTVHRTPAEASALPGGTLTVQLSDVVGAVGRLLLVVPPEAAAAGVTLAGAALQLGDKARIPFASAAVHGLLTPYFKCARAAGPRGRVLWLTFGGGAPDGGSPTGAPPTATLSLARADKPAVVVQWGTGFAAADVPPRLPPLVVYAEVWNVWEVCDGWGRVAYP